MALTPEQVQAIQLILNNMESKLIRIEEMKNYVAGMLTYNDVIDQPPEVIMSIVFALKNDAKITAQELVTLLE